MPISAKNTGHLDKEIKPPSEADLAKKEQEFYSKYDFLHCGYCGWQGALGLTAYGVDKGSAGETYLKIYCRQCGSLIAQE